jgi:hypothetical protein
MTFVLFAQIASKGMGAALAGKPRVGELQVNWVRSEDLKVAKVAAAPVDIIARQTRFV